MLDPALSFSHLPNIILPNLYVLLSAPAAVILFFVVWLLEGFLLWRILPTTKHWRDSFLMNSASTMLGWFPLLLINIIHGWLPNRAVWLLGGWAISIVSEWVVINLLEKQIRPKKLAISSLIVNTASYLLIFLVTLLIPQADWKAFGQNGMWDNSQGLCDFTITVTTWQDINENGQMEADEPPLPAVRLTLIEYPRGVPLFTDSHGMTTEEVTDYSCAYWKHNGLGVKPIVPEGCRLTTAVQLTTKPYQFGFLCDQPDQASQAATREADYLCEYASFGSFEDYYQAHDYKTAIYVSNCMLEQAVGQGEYADRIYVQRARAEAVLQQIPKAIEDYECALDLADSTVDGDIWIYNSACLYIGIYGQPQQALSYCEEAVRRTSQGNWKDSYKNRGLVYARLGRYEEAAADFQVYLDSMEGHDTSGELEIRAQYSDWLEILKAGENPFTADVLEEMRIEAP